MNTALIKRFFIRLYEKSFDEDIFSSSAQVAFYFLFALFPLLLFLVNIFGIVLGSNNEMRAELFNYLGQIIPASAFDLVSKTLDEVVQGSSGGKLTFGLLATLYSASAGIDSVRIALNAVYKLKEERDWWKRKLMSVVLTLALGVLIFVALGIIFYGSQFVNLIFGKIGFPINSPLLLKTLAVIIVLAVLIIAFDVLYYFVPNHKNLKWKWLTPGAGVAIGLWLLFSKSFSVYLQYFFPVLQNHFRVLIS
jgi:membrane protein